MPLSRIKSRITRKLGSSSGTFTADLVTGPLTVGRFVERPSPRGSTPRTKTSSGSRSAPPPLPRRSLSARTTCRRADSLVPDLYALSWGLSAPGGDFANCWRERT